MLINRFIFYTIIQLTNEVFIMSISASTLSPKFLGAEALVSQKLSGTKLDKEFANAFERLDLKKATELVKMGANPNQEITLSKPLVAEFLKLYTLCDCCGPVNPYDGAIEEFLADDENFQSAINEFFDGETSSSAIFLSMTLKKEDFSVLLLEKGAETLFRIGELESNLLQLASMINLPKVAEFALQNTSYRVDETENEEVALPPFLSAVMFGNLDIIKLFLEMRPNQVDSMILDLLANEEFQDEIEDGNLKLIEIKELLEEHLKRKEITSAVRV